MDWKLELVAVPVSDVDRAKRFYTEQVGFNADHDHKISDELRFVQLTPPGSACSIALGTGVTDAEPGSATGLQMVVSRHRGRPRPPRRPRRRGLRGPGLPLGPVRVLQRPRRQPLGGPADRGSQAVRLGEVELPVADAGEEGPPLTGRK